MDYSLVEVAEMLRDQIFFRIAQISTEERFKKAVPRGLVACRGGAAIGVKTQENDITLFVSEINANLHDYWEDESGRYAAYAGMKAITALQTEARTADTGVDFSFSGAVHRGGVPYYLETYGAWIAIAFSGFESFNDEKIVNRALQEFFIDNEIAYLRSQSTFHP